MLRDQLLTDWLNARFPDSLPMCSPASADASFRRYFRLVFQDGSTSILMDAPPDKEDCKPFIQVAKLFESAGIAAARVLESDLDQGFLLLNDLGNVVYLDALRADPSKADALMRPVLEVLVRWQQASKAATLPPYDAILLHREMNLFPEWFVGQHLQESLSDTEKNALALIFNRLIQSALGQPKVFVHRDFMPRNLMYFNQAPAVLDFQDAVFGPITYDLVSLFRDAFISWEEAQELDWVARYWEKARAFGLPVREDFGQFWREYEWMGLQRHLKVLGIFCRLYYRDGKTNYLSDLPRFVDYVRKTASRYQEFSPLLALLDRLQEGFEAKVQGF